MKHIAAQPYKAMFFGKGGGLTIVQQAKSIAGMGGIPYF
jgi:hypothetical protein